MFTDPFELSRGVKRDSRDAHHRVNGQVGSGFIFPHRENLRRLHYHATRYGTVDIVHRQRARG